MPQFANSVGFASDSALAKKSEIDQCMSDIDGQIELATDRLSALQIALGSVLTPASPSDVGKSDEKSPSTPLGQSLAAQKYRLYRINEGLLDLLERIAL